MAQPNRGCLDGFTLRTARIREARAARTVPHVFSQQQSGFPLTDGDLPDPIGDGHGCVLNLTP